MTPDQLPPGLRVKALEWDGFDADPYSVCKGLDGLWLAWYGHEFCDVALDSEIEAKAACQRHHEEQICAQLEIVNG